MAYVAIRSKTVILLLFIHCVQLLPVYGCLFGVVLSVISYITIILLRKREQIAVLHCVISVGSLQVFYVFFLAIPWLCLRYCKCSKIRTFLFLFTNKMLLFRLEFINFLSE